ncbi:MAG: DUF3445 domain-containing protein [Aestuariivirga sp.]
MSSGPVIHTPYDGSSKPFTIGLAQLDDAQWLEEDQNLPFYLNEKLNLYKTLPDKVLVEDEGTREAQSEVLALVQAHVLKHFPNLYQHDGNVMRIGGQHNVQLDDPTLSPIAIAALLVQEDLVLMRKSPEGWRLAAASLCFPSAWNLLEKFMRPLHEIHAPVPDFGEGTRNAGLIERMFDNLNSARSVLRWNWSLYGDDRLYHPLSDNGMKRRFGEGDDIRGRVTLRLERQTLRKLPQSGDILFTIRIYLDPLEALERHAEGATLAHCIEHQLLAMTDEQIAYRGLADERARLCARLRDIAERAKHRA